MSNELSSSAVPLKKSLSKVVPTDNNSKKLRKQSGPDDAASVLTEETLLILRKKYFFPNSLMYNTCKKSERVNSPPPGYISILEMTLKAGLRFPLADEFVGILTAFEACISQLSCRAVMVIMGLIAIFREHGARLSLNSFARFGKLVIDTRGHVTFRSKWLDLTTKDFAKGGSGRFFFVRNDWGLPEKWGKLKDPSVSRHFSEDDILRALNIKTVEEFQLKARFLYNYTKEESLFKLGLSFQPGRSDARRLKKSVKTVEASVPLLKDLGKHLCGTEKDLPAPKKAKVVEIVDGETKICIPDDILNHHCTGFQQFEEYLSQRSKIEAKLDTSAKRWNSEYVRMKFLHGEIRRMYHAKVKEFRDSDALVGECRAEIASLATTISLQQKEIDRVQGEVFQVQLDHDKTLKDLKTADAEKLSFERKLKQLSEVDVAVEKSKVIEEFKKSFEFKKIVQEQVEKAREKIYDTEVKSLERQSLDEGLLRGFFKGIHLVHRRTGALIDDLTYSQISEDSTEDSDDDADSIRPVEIDSDVDVV